MFEFMSHRYCFSAVLGAALGFATVAYAAESQTRLQEIADQAALTGAVSLGTSDASSEAGRRAEAIKASKEILNAVPLRREIIASVQDLTVTIKLSASDAQVTSTAHYVPPDQPANWAWAGRQHFALKRAPIVVGSTCLRNCDLLH